MDRYKVDYVLGECGVCLCCVMVCSPEVSDGLAAKSYFCLWWEYC